MHTPLSTMPLIVPIIAHTARPCLSAPYPDPPLQPSECIMIARLVTTTICNFGSQHCDASVTTLLIEPLDHLGVYPIRFSPLHSTLGAVLSQVW